jgi:multidrug efflux pump subunit AcrA (membrane-fusion protein)
MNRKPIALLFVFLLLPFYGYGKSPLLLTGKISSAQKQVVTAPKSSRWQVQIQWLEDEGKVVNKGDLIAVFDGSDIQSQLELNRERAETLELELTQSEMELGQTVFEAEGQLNVALMRVELATIEASVPASEVSRFDKGNYQLTLQRALLEQVKAEERLALQKQAFRTGVQKKKIELLKVLEDIAYQESQLTKMSVTAELTGPITYAMHPWGNQKIAAGINVNASWQILDIQGSDNFQIESWVHEIDADKIPLTARVDMVMDAYPGIRFRGKLLSKSTQSEKKTQWSNSVYYPLIFTFEEPPEQTLLPGMSVRMELDLPTIEVSNEEAD